MSEAPKRRGRPKEDEETKRQRREAKAAAKAAGQDPKGVGNKPKAGKEVEHARVHLEDLTDEQEEYLFIQHRKSYDAALAKKKEADAELRNVCKKAKGDLGATVIDQIKLSKALESDEGKRFLKERVAWQAKIARWNGMPIGHIDDLFPVEDRTPIEDRTFADGKKAGMAGDDPTPPHHLDGPLRSKWTDGYHAGQAVNLDKLETRVGATFGTRPPEEPVETEAERDGTYWMRVGRVAFEKRHNGEVPDDVPEEHREDWRTGYLNAQAAEKHRHAVAA